ncbi:MAG TPA: EamA family transporter [Ramlibacter sp.]|jgi:O-acetylserine/cysteine efflux transporter
MADGAELKGRDLAAILVVILVWGTNFVAMKVGLASFTPFQLGAGRFVFAFLPLALMLRHPGAAPRWIIAFGLAQGLGQFGLLFVALHVGMTAALASVLLQMHVFFSAGLGVVLLGERVGKPLKVGMPFAAVGLACFGLSVAGSAAASVTALGLVLTVAAAFMWATSNIVVRFAQRDAARFDATAFVAWSGSVSIVPFLAMSWWFDPPGSAANWLKAPWQGWVALAFLGWVATNLGYGLWTNLLRKYPASRVAPFSLGVPVIGLGAGILLLGETVVPLQWAGALLVLCALLCVMIGPRLAARS